jgi:hypothetical protein
VPPRVTVSAARGGAAERENTSGLRYGQDFPRTLVPAGTMMEAIVKQRCRPPARQQAGSGLVAAVASAAGARNAASVSSSSVRAVDRRMGESGDYTGMRTAVVPTATRKMLALTLSSC